MFTSTAWLALVGLIAVTAADADARQQPPAPPIIQPGAPGQPSRVITAETAADTSAGRFTEADVRFMQGMIGHHAQALEMTALVADRTTSPDLRKLALRIEISQADEISMMEEWLKARDQPLPDPHAHHAHDAARMPGMLTGAEMARLAAARGLDFERLFLEFMIKHHDGALVMVKELFASPGAGQESDIYAFASDVEADQFMEIRRMAAMLKELQK
jgi:uncharacterized protein (DUF305 family)